MKLRISGLGAHSSATWLRTQGCARLMNSRRKRASTTPYVTTRTPSGKSKLSLHLPSKVCITLHTSPTNSFLRCFIESEDHIISYHIISLTPRCSMEEELDTTSKRIPLLFPLKDELKGDGPLAPPSGLLEQLKQQLDQGVCAKQGGVDGIKLRRRRTVNQIIYAQRHILTLHSDIYLG